MVTCSSPGIATGQYTQWLAADPLTVRACSLRMRGLQERRNGAVAAMPNCVCGTHHACLGSNAPQICPLRAYCLHTGRQRPWMDGWLAEDTCIEPHAMFWTCTCTDNECRGAGGGGEGGEVTAAAVATAAVGVMLHTDRMAQAGSQQACATGGRKWTMQSIGA